MKRHTDHEGRAESAGPLFDALAPIERALRMLDFEVTVDPSLPPDTIEFRDHDGRVVGRMVDVTQREVSELRRDLGIARASLGAEHAAPGWEEQALADLRTFARTHHRFAVEDFRAAFPPPPGVNPKALGAVVRRAARERIVIADGYVAVRCSNMSPRVAWKSLVFEGSPTS